MDSDKMTLLHTDEHGEVRGGCDEHGDLCIESGANQRAYVPPAAFPALRALLDGQAPNAFQNGNGWRKEPPTAEEVRANPWWWCKPVGYEAAPLKLYVRADGEVSAARTNGAALSHCTRPTDEWSPCLPPTTPMVTQAEVEAAVRRALESAAVAVSECEVERHGGYYREDDGAATLRGAESAVRALAADPVRVAEIARKP